MKTLFQTLFFFFYALGICLTGCGKQSFDERVAQEVAYYNQRNAGHMTDSVTRIDSMAYDIPSKTLRYYYSLLGVADNPTLITEKVRQQNLQAIQQNVRTSIALREHKAHGLCFEYIYRSQKSGRILLQQRVTKSQYDTNSTP